jgi:hypothetical protein
MKVVSADPFCSVVWWGHLSTNCPCTPYAEVPSVHGGPWKPLGLFKAKHSPGLHMEPSTSGRDIVVLLDFVLYIIRLSCCSGMQQDANDHEPDASGNL